MSELANAADALLNALLKAEPSSVGNLDRLTVNLESQLSKNRLALTTVGARSVDGVPTASAHDSLARYARWLIALIQNKPDAAAMRLLAARTRDFEAKVRSVLKHEAELVTDWLAEVSPIPQTSTPTIWSHGGLSYSCDRVHQIVVTPEEDYVLRAFEKEGIAMSTRDLVDKSGVTSVSRVIRQLIKKYGEQFASAIRTPKGKKNAGGYFIRVRNATQVT